jgi:hypothetical protein
MKVRLEAKDGGEVYATKIPVYRESPMVLFYDGRAYVRTGMDGEVAVYQACFAYVIRADRSTPAGEMMDLKDMPDMKDF